MKKRSLRRTGPGKAANCSIDEIVEPAERLLSKIARDIVALEAEERYRSTEILAVAAGLFLGVSRFSYDGA